MCGARSLPCLEALTIVTVIWSLVVLLILLFFLLIIVIVVVIRFTDIIAVAIIFLLIIVTIISSVLAFCPELDHLREIILNTSAHVLTFWGCAKAAATFLSSAQGRDEDACVLVLPVLLAFFQLIITIIGSISIFCTISTCYHS